MNTKYEVVRPSEVGKELEEFLSRELPKLNYKFGNKYDINNALIYTMMMKGIFLVGKRNGEIRGIHISWLNVHPFDCEQHILMQQLFYVMPDSGRMAFHLFNKFIDIGKESANHIITMTNEYTNIKSETLEKYGFKEIEKMFRMEIEK